MLELGAGSMTGTIAHRAVEQEQGWLLQGQEEASPPASWPRRMSDNTAYALLAYTSLQIFVTIGALRDGSSSLLPYLALVLLVVGILPACHWFEQRWSGLGAENACDPALAGRFRRDRAMLWALALGMPFAITGLIGALGLLLG
ncbi:MAG TPA: hypothetical protein VFF98_05665 [Novosphingobium sp.]|nr:hypothetical protein [Novosphingobium sp.]HZV11149.1 hypothetical protein [Novosphingobium sp.]